MRTRYQMLGRTSIRGPSFCRLDNGQLDGCVSGDTCGTYLHSLFDSGEVAEALVRLLCERKGLDPIFIFVFRWGIMGAANESVYYTEYGVRCFRVYLCMTILAAVNTGSFIYLQSLGKAFASTAISMVHKVVFGLGFALLFPQFFGLNGVLYSMPVSDLLTFVICGAVIVYTCRALDADTASHHSGRLPEPGLS